MKEIHKFVQRLFKEHHLDKKDPDAMQKLIEMLEEKVLDLTENGLSEEEAVHKTIIEFGELEDYYAPLMKKENKRYKRQKTINHYKNDLLFSSLSTLIIIAILMTINIQIRLTYIEDFGYWFIIPSLGVLFWPLSLLYKFLNKKGE